MRAGKVCLVEEIQMQALESQYLQNTADLIIWYSPEVNLWIKAHVRSNIRRNIRIMKRFQWL